VQAISILYKSIKDIHLRNIRDHAPNNKILHEPKGVCALITPWIGQ